MTRQERDNAMTNEEHEAFLEYMEANGNDETGPEEPTED